MEKYFFCTLFDSFYLSRGLVLYRSLENLKVDFHLYILAMDDVAIDILDKLKLKKASVVSLKEFETQELLEVKKDRNRSEYSWTCASSFLKYVLENFDVDHCTYLDSDMKFYSSPKPFFDELGSKSVLITPHNYSSLYKPLERNGKYCVQFVTIKKDDLGLKVLNWWVDQCISWCYARIEKGKFGDQKYLDEFEIKFEGVHSLIHEGALAPWNVQRFILNSKNLTFKSKITEEENKIVFYHFHDLKCFDNDKIDYGFYKLSEEAKKIYDSYMLELIDADRDIRKLSKHAKPLGFATKQKNSKELLKQFLRILMGANNVYNIKDFEVKDE